MTAASSARSKIARSSGSKSISRSLPFVALPTPEMTKPEACASCGALDLASPGAGWVTGKPQTFKPAPHHRGREVLYLCSSGFTMELAARQRNQINLRSMELFDALTHNPPPDNKSAAFVPPPAPHRR